MGEPSVSRWRRRQLVEPIDCHAGAASPRQLAMTSMDHAPSANSLQSCQATLKIEDPRSRGSSWGSMPGDAEKELAKPVAASEQAVKKPANDASVANAIVDSTSTTARTPASITLRGVRTHNLKAIDLDLPLKRMIVVTGPSGAGKSSLAFDTLYAEGHRRYVETFSPYTRQFLVRLDKPDAELIAGIPPAIAVGSPRIRRSPRTTVGTITEVHHALGSLFARAGEVKCRQCGQTVAPASPETVSRAIEEWPEGTRYEIGFPLEILAGTDQPALLSSLRARGFTRLRVGSHSTTLDGPDPPLPSDSSIDVIVDRLVRGSDRIDRRADSIETAFEHGLGRCRAVALGESRTFVRGWRCSHCGTDHIEPQPALFRYNSPLGACPVCEGTGRTVELDMDRIVPDPSRSIRSGAIAPWSIPVHHRYLDELLAVAASLDLPVDVPFKLLGPAQVELLIDGDSGRRFFRAPWFFSRPRSTHATAPKPVVPESLQASGRLSGLSRRTTQTRGARRQDRRSKYRRALGHDRS